MISVLSLNCPVCGAPFSPGAERCGYCNSILVLQSDHPRIDPRTLNRVVVDERIAEYRSQLRGDPGSVQAHYGLGVAYFNLGLTEAAIDSLEKACSLTPENPHIHTQLAVAWREEGKTGDPRANEEMQDHIRYALRLDPNNVEALILGSEAAAADHDIERAVSMSEKAWTLEPDRAQALHERMLRLWIGWKQQRHDLVNADFLRVERFSPALVDELRGGGGSFVPPASVATGMAFTPPLQSGTGQVLRATITAFLTGLGIFVVSCVLIVTLVETESGTTASAMTGLLLLALMTLPIIMATRAWYKARQKDSIS